MHSVTKEEIFRSGFISNGWSIPYNHKNIPRAKLMRRRPTEAEKLLWRYLRKKQLSGYKFLRQRTIGHYIVDFYCAKLKLVIEVDGGIHNLQKEYDFERSEFLKMKNITIIRIKNEDVIGDIKKVLGVIQQVIDSLEPPPIQAHTIRKS